MDPIDGTKAFLRGVPLYGVLIGLEVEGTCEIGGALFPALDEIVYAATGEGCYCNGRRIKVSSAETLEGGILSFTDAANFEEHGREEAFRRLRGAAGSSRGWSDAYGHALVATGRVELMLEPVMNPWDCAPSRPSCARPAATSAPGPATRPSKPVRPSVPRTRSYPKCSVSSEG